MIVLTDPVSISSAFYRNCHPWSRSGSGRRSHGPSCKNNRGRGTLGPLVVIRKSDAGGALNARLGKTLKNNRQARTWKDLRHILIGLLLILAIALVVFLIFMPIP